MISHRLCYEKCSFQVDIHQQFPLLFRILQAVPVIINSRVVRKDVDLLAFCRHFLYARIDTLCVRHVEVHAERFSAHLFDQAFAFFRFYHIGKRDLRAIGSQR